MNLKGIFAAVLVSVLMLNLSVFAADKQGENSKPISKMEILLKVGESNISIDGRSVQVETPYILNSTTLVPLRVITEAFGANVDWKEATQEITLTYSDVKIGLQIGRKTAMVNSQQLDLLEAPELKNGVTMVPFRFITENFGADVTFNSDTSEITVTKLNAESNSIRDYSMVLKRTQKDKIGDSYWGWSMQLPKTLDLKYRSFDGRKSVFYNMMGETEFNIIIGVTKNKNDMSMEQLLASDKEMIKDYTLINQGSKKSSDGIEYSVSEYKSKTNYYYSRATLKDGNIIYVDLEISNDANKTDVSNGKKEAKLIADSFTVAYKNGDGVEDLSDVDKSGYRVFDNKDFKVSLKVPADYNDLSDEDVINEFRFAKYTKDNILDGMVHLAIYSQSSDLTLDGWIKRDKGYNTEVINSKYAKFSEISDIQIGDIAAKYYKFSVEIEKPKITEVTYDIFFVKGDYGYNLSIDMNKDDFDRVKEILDSFKAEILDKDKVGQISVSSLELTPVTRTYTSKNNGYKIQIPTSWRTDSSDSSGELFGSDDHGMVFVVSAFDESKQGSIEDHLTNFQESMVKKGGKVIGNIVSVKIDGKKGYKSVVQSPNSNKLESDTVVTTYVVNFNGKDYLLQSIVSERINGVYCNRIFDNIINTFKFE